MTASKLMPSVATYDPLASNMKQQIEKKNTDYRNDHKGTKKPM